MSKDQRFYERRILQKQKSNFEQAISGLSGDELLAMYDNFSGNENTDLMLRIGVHLHEAFAIIQKILSDPKPTDPEKIYDLDWTSRVPERGSASSLAWQSQPMRSSMTRAEMLDRLHWISSEEFGEDLDEWVSWMAAFKENPPAWGYR